MLTTIFEKEVEIESPYEYEEIENLECLLFSDILKEENYVKYELLWTYKGNNKLLINMENVLKGDLNFLKNNMMILVINIVMKNKEQKKIKKLVLLDIREKESEFILLE